MKNKIKIMPFFTTFSAISLIFAGTGLFSGCAGTAQYTIKAGEKGVDTLLPADTVPLDSDAALALLALRVDTLRQGFMMMPGRRPVFEGAEQRWQSLTREAARLKRTVHASLELEYLLGELSRIGIFFNKSGAAHTAEYYLSECVGFGGTEGKDFRPYLSLAWLNLHKGCQLSEKTHDLLVEAEKRSEDKEYPYLGMLWGYYYYSCERDPERALPYFQAYLAFDPHDDRAVKIYKEIRKKMRKE